MAPHRRATIRLGTFNVPFNLHVGTADAEITKFIELADPDVFGTQEMWGNDRDQIINNCPGWAWHRPKQTAHSDECTIFWSKDRFKALDHFCYQIAPPMEGGAAPGRFLNGVLLHSLDLNRNVWFLNTHLDALSNINGDRNRIRSEVQAISGEIARLSKYGVPVFMVGDFNQNYFRKPMLRDAFHSVRTHANWELYGRKPLWYGTHGRSYIDTLWINRPVHHNIKIEHQQVHRGYKSDHRPLTVDVSMPVRPKE